MEAEAGILPEEHGVGRCSGSNRRGEKYRISIPRQRRSGDGRAEGSRFMHLTFPAQREELDRAWGRGDHPRWLKLENAGNTKWICHGLFPSG